MKIIRVSVSIVLAIAAWVYIPVPSQMTPNAKMNFNNWANLVSPRLAAFGFNLHNHESFPKCNVRGYELMVVRSEDKVNNPDILTFQFDNIAALAVRFLVLIFIYVVCFKASFDFAASRKSIYGLFLSVMLFSLLFLIRAVAFGVLVVNNPVEYIGVFDNLFRFVMISPFVIPIVLNGAKDKNTGVER